MEKIKYFLKSLVIPRHMARYRHMSVLISLIIFVLSISFIDVPLSYNTDNTKGEILESYNFLVFKEVDESLDNNPDNDAVLKALSELECVVKEGELACKDDPKDVIFDEEIVIEVAGITKRINIIVNLEEKYSNPSAFDLNDVIVTLEDQEYVANEEFYKITFFKGSVVYQAHQKGINGEGTDEIRHNTNLLAPQIRHYTYANYMPELNLKAPGDTNYKNISLHLADKIADGDIIAAKGYNFIFLILNLVIFPLFIVFIFWLFFRKSGRLTTFKEYYNIAAISSILPVIVIFIASWFIAIAMNAYLLMFPLFYVFVVYKINFLPEDQLDN